MPVQNHPKYAEWTDALDKLKEANDRYRDEVRIKGDVETAAQELGNAQKAFDQISDEIG